MSWHPELTDAVVELPDANASDDLAVHPGHGDLLGADHLSYLVGRRASAMAYTVLTSS